MTTPSPAGWYPDPDGNGGQRYFDGYQWTQHRNLPVTGPPRQSRGKVLAIVGGIVALLVIGVCITALRDSDSPGSLFEAEPAAMNTTVSDGKFSFRITDVTIAPAAAGTGSYAVVIMTVSNTGGEPQSFFANNQKLFDSNGNEYAADAMAALSMNDGQSMVIDMNPGFAMTVRIPYAIPAGVAPETIELHDSAFSEGVKVSLDEQG